MVYWLFQAPRIPKRLSTSVRRRQKQGENLTSQGTAEKFPETKDPLKRGPRESSPPGPQREWYILACSPLSPSFDTSVLQDDHKQ
ncbi:hypothetical protein M404DRAFT_999585 [Pisolithus tinctorius Marx 270]|uniref:Uncharacterized protein n=1 Tax=Pisolithus tinctorius Marx 270 TaxID=870435 RepID=A0A0C3K8I8_PISTI|nr:hypothetical protein M404DRAFT_999585 [Pisolithus tinctorius Marx 270]